MMPPASFPVAFVAALAAFGPAPAPRPAKVPGVVWTATTAANAAHVDARIAEVTVFSDRARVRRRGRAPAAGIQAVRFPRLPGAAYLDTIRVSVTGGRVLRVEATPVQREQSSVAQAARLRDALDAVADRLAEIDDRRATDDWEIGFLRALAPAPLVPEDKREGRKNPSADVASWWKALDFIGERTRAASGHILTAQGERAQLVKEKQRLLADYKAINRVGLAMADQDIDVVAVVEVDRAEAPLELEYFIPGARWKPAYDLHFASATGQIRIETAGVVEQTTGEDWSDVALLLSTARPGRGIDLPERLAWTLGERSEFIPQLRERRPPEIYFDHIDRDRDAIVDDFDGCPDQPEDHEGTDDGCPEPESYNGNGKGPREDREPLMDLQVTRSPALARPSPAKRSILADAPALRKIFGSDPEPTTTLPLALLDKAPSEVPSSPYLPVVSAGGFDFVYRAPTKATIASSNKKIRVPLASQSFRTAFFHAATPGLAKTAFLRARVRNDGKRPLLRGPVTIFGDGEFVATGEIKTTGPGGDIDLPLGADPDVRIERHVAPSTKTTGLIMKSDETSYDVVIQVGNYKRQKVTIEIVDQLPRSERDKVEVKLLGAQPAALGAPDADGLIRWRLELPPGATQTVKLSYRIIRPKGWELNQQ